MWQPCIINDTVFRPPFSPPPPPKTLPCPRSPRLSVTPVTAIKVAGDAIPIVCAFGAVDAVASAERITVTHGQVQHVVTVPIFNYKARQDGDSEGKSAFFFCCGCFFAAGARRVFFCCGCAARFFFAVGARCVVFCCACVRRGLSSVVFCCGHARGVFFVAAGAGRVFFFVAGARRVFFLLRVRGAFFFCCGCAARFFLLRVRGAFFFFFSAGARRVFFFAAGARPVFCCGCV